MAQAPDPRDARLDLKCAVPENLPELCRLMYDACARIVLEREKFPELGNGRGQRRFLFTSPDRERRIERLVAMCLVARSIALHMDVLTCRSGKSRRDGSCDAVDEEQMTKETGLTHWSLTRAKRDLIDAGFLTWHQEVKRYCTCDAIGCQGVPKGLCADGGERRYRALPAILTVTLSFFVKLGIAAQKVKDLQRGTYEWRRSFPQPMADILLRRARQQAIRAQELAAKAAASAVESASRMVMASAARVAKMYGKKNE